MSSDSHKSHHVAATAGSRPDALHFIALVLAAGRGHRFGSDKRRARLPDGRELLCATVDSVLPYFAQTFVVLRQEDSALAMNLPAGASVLHAAHAHEGMGASLADGIRALHGIECDAVAVVLGDMPWVTPDTLHALTEQANPSRIVRPVHKGRGGHPVIFGHEFWTALSALGQDEGARGILTIYRDYIDEIEVDDPGIWRDVDQPQDIA
ncbi:nucleotidyltransferase family protein [Phytohalomonas tamaricis]|uniref:nucleotidyltransferase family protein n=1 Tax=Phytohalomonas tamaricis TaxID=2081032 RepID=UPI000D0BC3BF|nr:nucleotidyltransferase family protein [Phytohalomonas tamaricis]